MPRSKHLRDVTKFSWTTENLLGTTTDLSSNTRFFHNPVVQELQVVFSDVLPNVGSGPRDLGNAHRGRSTR